MTAKVVFTSKSVVEETHTTTLKEVRAEYLTLEVQVVFHSDGRDISLPTETQEVPREVASADAEISAAYPGKPPGAYEAGTEKLKVGGVEYDCKWFRIRNQFDGADLDGQNWLCDAVPGRRVKSVHKQTSAKLGDGISVIEVTKVVIKN